MIEKCILNSFAVDLFCKFHHCTVEPLLMVTSPQLPPLYNGHLSTAAILFCPQGGHCREVQLYYCISICVLRILRKISRLSHRHRGEKM